MFATRTLLTAVLATVAASASIVDRRGAQYHQTVRPVSFPDGQTNCGYDLNNSDQYTNWVAVPEAIGNNACGQKVTLWSGQGQSTATIVSIGTEDPQVTNVSERVWNELGLSFPETREIQADYNIDGGNDGSTNFQDAPLGRRTWGWRNRGWGNNGWGNGGYGNGGWGNDGYGNGGWGNDGYGNGGWGNGGYGYGGWGNCRRIGRFWSICS
ncbi:unnamed protein product [Sympodiomycopsis kandeliae]